MFGKLNKKLGMGKPHKLKSRFLMAPSVPGRMAEDPELQLLRDGADRLVPTIISYGTRGTKYEASVATLRDKCHQLGVKESIETIPNCGRQNACLFKPTFIKLKLLTLGEPVIWLDGDASIKAAILFDDSSWDVGTVNNIVPSEINDKASSCIAFQPTIAALRFLEAWEQLCSNYLFEHGLDHRRFNYTRFILKNDFAERDIAEIVSGKVITDEGNFKRNEL